MPWTFTGMCTVGFIIEKVFQRCEPSFLVDMVDALRFSKIAPSLVRAGMILVFKRNLGTEDGQRTKSSYRRKREIDHEDKAGAAKKPWKLHPCKRLMKTAECHLSAQKHRSDIKMVIQLTKSRDEVENELRRKE